MHPAAFSSPSLSSFRFLMVTWEAVVGRWESERGVGDVAPSVGGNRTRTCALVSFALPTEEEISWRRLAHRTVGDMTQAAEGMIWRSSYVLVSHRMRYSTSFWAHQPGIADAPLDVIIIIELWVIASERYTP
ncbi:hypothetical protein B0H16DRAFT_1745173 [Mycena metata]|uniref:Uncharacterized protein n=1 Tax=Mycena metata TaxID=1033252 RepID=A0AAD7H3F7_9AGAR|nr:hypothetical protein B0H16DRAFT_1745173 [Mycena metata]